MTLDEHCCDVCHCVVLAEEKSCQECTEQELTPEVYMAWADACDEVRDSALENESSMDEVQI